MALLKRKELIANRKITKGFIANRAKLIGKKTGNDKYELISDFSKAKVEHSSW